MEPITRTPVLTYAAPEIIEAGFALGQPVLDVHVDGQYAGCLFRSYRNEGRRLVETYQFHQKSGRPEGTKFATLEELILWTQAFLLKHA